MVTEGDMVNEDDVVSGGYVVNEDDVVYEGYVVNECDVAAGIRGQRGWGIPEGRPREYMEYK